MASDLPAQVTSEKNRSLLRRILDRASLGDNAHRQLALYTQIETTRNVIEDFEDALGIYRLRWKGSEEEAHFKVQGYVASHSLSSMINARERMDPATACQEIVLTGDRESGFRHVLQGVETIFEYFQRMFTEDYVLPMNECTAGDLQSVAFQTRYFTPKNSDTTNIATDLPKEMDPRGVLRDKLKQFTGFLFTTENLVRYFVQNKQGSYLDDTATVTSINRSSPMRIRRGLLVELDVVFLLVPSRGFKRKFVPSFRSVTILDDGCVFDVSTKRKRVDTNLDHEISRFAQTSLG